MSAASSVIMSLVIAVLLHQQLGTLHRGSSEVDVATTLDNVYQELATLA
jgi:hypothetical protein